MSEIERSTPGIPFITKVATALDKESDVRAGINFVNRMDKVRQQAREGRKTNIKTMEETPIVTAEDIKDEMYR